MKDWESIIVGIEYLLQFKKNPMDWIEKMRDAVILKRGLSFEIEETLEAIHQASKSSVDLSKLLPQPHSDRVLRDFFTALEESLRKAQ